MKKNGGSCVTTGVGDRYVLEEMMQNDYTLGGEQSGHIIFAEHAKTGDGILTAVKLLGAMANKNQSLSQLGALMQIFPQILLNIRVKNKSGWEENENIRQITEHYKKCLGENGQILVRASGTEPLIRIMAEGPDQTQLERIAEAIAVVVRHELG